MKILSKCQYIREIFFFFQNNAKHGYSHLEGKLLKLREDMLSPCEKIIIHNEKIMVLQWWFQNLPLYKMDLIYTSRTIQIRDKDFYFSCFQGVHINIECTLNKYLPIY